MFGNRMPMTPQQIEAAQRDLERRQWTMGQQPFPTDVGSGLTSLGGAIGYRLAKHRLDSQFPAAPTAPGDQQQPSAHQKIGQWIRGNFGSGPDQSAAPNVFSVRKSQPGGGFFGALFRRNAGGGLY